MRKRLASFLVSASLAGSIALGASLAVPSTAAAATFYYGGFTCSVYATTPQYANNSLRMQGQASCGVSWKMLIDVYTQEYAGGWKSFWVQSASSTTGPVAKAYSIAPVHGYSYRTSVNFFMWDYSRSTWVYIGTTNSGSTWVG